MSTGPPPEEDSSQKGSKRQKDKKRPKDTSKGAKRPIDISQKDSKVMKDAYQKGSKRLKDKKRPKDTSKGAKRPIDISQKDSKVMKDAYQKGSKRLKDKKRPKDTSKGAKRPIDISQKDSKVMKDAYQKGSKRLKDTSQKGSSRQKDTLQKGSKRQKDTLQKGSKRHKVSSQSGPEPRSKSPIGKSPSEAKTPDSSSYLKSVCATQFFKSKYENVIGLQGTEAAKAPRTTLVDKCEVRESEYGTATAITQPSEPVTTAMGGATAKEKQLILSDLQNEKYYHGILPREDIELMLQKDGDFMVRKTEVDNKVRIVLSVKWKNSCSHILLHRSRTGFWFLKDETSFEDIAELVSHYRKKKITVTPDGTLLKHPVPRQSWELGHDSILIEKKLGEGAFGEVYKGEMCLDQKRKIPVAVKTLRGIEATKSQRQEFVKEARLMRQLRHKHIVSLYGVCAQEQPMMIVMELAPGGSLLKHLREKGHNISLREHVRYCVDSAKGMSYLEKNKVIHRDVAARNCLLGDKQDVKVSDFGLGLLATTVKADASQKVPIRWLAPETLQTMTFTLKSDVWSFGIMMWEVFSDGLEPYPDLKTSIQVKEAVGKEKYKMEPPFGTPFAVRELINKLWQQEPDDRPSFRYITKELKNTYSSLRNTS